MVPSRRCGSFCGAVHGDLPGAVLQGRVGKAGEELVAIGLEIGARHGQGRHHLLGHKPMNELVDSGVGDGLVDVLIARQVAEIAHGGVRAVEHAELHQLEGLDVLDHLGADGFEGRAAGGEVVLDHPLGEGLGHDRPSIFQAADFLDDFSIRIGRGGHDAVDHGRGKLTD